MENEGALRATLLGMGQNTDVGIILVTRDWLAGVHQSTLPRHREMHTWNVKDERVF